MEVSSSLHLTKSAIQLNRKVLVLARRLTVMSMPLALVLWRSAAGVSLLEFLIIPHDLLPVFLEVLWNVFINLTYYKERYY